ncbi:cytochrome b subunit of succinate dehydrogenase, Sdh3p [Malassezia vespertilionis]|uniref:Sdh3p n=1 Tax=Malassezia vespertilionis TaxID=2020962 RepID=A0A2N1JBE9_9BASI|nr:cytochrome b subunit of succinate dehydrogenase, Sdh3p [Malassezia vespertilionis]PKI83881.1 Sdh3p [Malassezia vespertilionis]WFD07063.1 cytochrome b subunit of succinate dehydrogenase, Sdh3p [Malassezia vespertilionis]
MSRSPLAVRQSVMGAARFAPNSLVLPQPSRTLTTSPIVRALPWARNVKTVHMSEPQDLKNLNHVRMDRPISPELSIYQPQLTWYSSIFNRITGVGMSVLLYGYCMSYAVLPFTGYGELLSSVNVIQFFHELPVWAKLLVKAPLAATFSFHTFNGMRHLSWDSGYFLDLKTSYMAGYTVIGASILATVGLCML